MSSSDEPLDTFSRHENLAQARISAPVLRNIAKFPRYAVSPCRREPGRYTVGATWPGLERVQPVLLGFRWASPENAPMKVPRFVGLATAAVIAFGVTTSANAQRPSRLPATAPTAPFTQTPTAPTAPYTQTPTAPTAPLGTQPAPPRPRLHAAGDCPDRSHAARNCSDRFLHAAGNCSARALHATGECPYSQSAGNRPNQGDADANGSGQGHAGPAGSRQGHAVRLGYGEGRPDIQG